MAWLLQIYETICSLSLARERGNKLELLNEIQPKWNDFRPIEGKHETEMYKNG